MPPVIPSLGLKVLAASSRPRGTKIVISSPGASVAFYPGAALSIASRTASVIMRLGVLLMAALPTG